VGRAVLQGSYVDPRDLGPKSPLSDFVRAYLQELQDKGRAERTVARYSDYLSEFIAFFGPKAAPRVADLDVRSLKAFGSSLTRRQLRGGRRAGKGQISPASKNLVLIALRGLLKFGVLLELPVPGPEKVELAKAIDPNPDARHLEAERLKRLIDSFDTASDDGAWPCSRRAPLRDRLPDQRGHRARSREPGAGSRSEDAEGWHSRRR